MRGRFDRASTLYKDVSAQTASVFGADSRSFGEALSAAVPLDLEVGDLKTAIARGVSAIESISRKDSLDLRRTPRIRKLGNALLAARSTREAANNSQRLYVSRRYPSPTWRRYTLAWGWRWHIWDVSGSESAFAGIDQSE